MNSKKEEIKIFGIRAVHALFARRPDAIRKVYLSKKLTKEFSDLMIFCRDRRMAYKIVGEDDLERVSASLHHEGVVVIAEPAVTFSLDELHDQVKDQRKVKIILLESVENPHNLGAIIRTAAFFGVQGIVIASSSTRQLSAATYRTSEGAAEHIPVVFVKDPEGAVKFFKSKVFSLIATSPHAKTNIYDAKFPDRLVFIFGAEGSGLTPGTMKKATLSISIPGSGAVESLNVAQSVTAVLAIAGATK